MKTVKELFVCTLCLLAMGAQAQTKVIAHRGYWKCEGSAQNSIAALMKAADANVYGAEFDVQMSRDKEIVVNHDATIAGKLIADTDYAELKELRLKNGETLSTLDAYLNVGKQLPDLRLVLEIKPHRTAEEENEATDIIVRKVKEMNLESQVDYISFSLNICERLVALTPDSEISYLKGDLTPQAVQEKGIDGIDYSYKKVTENPTWIEEAQTLGIKVNVWTVNTPERIQELIDKKVDYITTDHPLEALGMVRRQ